MKPKWFQSSNLTNHSSVFCNLTYSISEPTNQVSKNRFHFGFMPTPVLSRVHTVGQKLVKYSEKEALILTIKLIDQKAQKLVSKSFRQEKKCSKI